MAPIYRIAKWKETFETSKTKEYKTLTWVSLPVGFSSNGYHELIEEFGCDAPMIYGAWCALLSVAAQAPERGTLASSKGSYTLSRIAADTRMPKEIFERLFEWASKLSVGWLEVVPDEPQVPVADEPGTEDSPAGSLPNGPNLTGPNLTKPDVTGHSNPPAREVRPVDVGKIWEEIQPKAEQMASTIEPNARKLGENFESCIKATVFREIHPELREPFDALVKQIHDKNRRNKPPDRPWGYLRSGIIRICNEHKLNFDLQWVAITIPKSILAPKGVFV